MLVGRQTSKQHGIGMTGWHMFAQPVAVSTQAVGSMTAFDIGGLYLHTLHSELDTFRYIISTRLWKTLLDTSG